MGGMKSSCFNSGCHMFRPYMCWLSSGCDLTYRAATQDVWGVLLGYWVGGMRSSCFNSGYHMFRPYMCWPSSGCDLTYRAAIQDVWGVLLGYWVLGGGNEI